MCARLFLGLFTKEAGGKAAATSWAGHIHEALNYRRINPPLDIIGNGGIFTPVTVAVMQSNGRAAAEADA